jgi:uncharacterized membrane protein
MHVTHSIEISAPIERVWELTVDVERWPQISPRTMRSVQRLDDGPLRVGSSALVKQPGQRATVWTVTELDAPRRFAWSARVLGTQMTATHELTATHVLSANGATVTNTLVVEAKGWLGRALARPVAAAISHENDRFKRAAEAHQPA